MLQLKFRSGMSSKSDLRGAMDAMAPVGVVADKLSVAAKLLSLPGYLNRGGAVFIDSGAFSEIKTGAEPDWESILTTYEMVAEGTHLKKNLYVVAPDKVGDQQSTLQRLAAYKARVNALMLAGCQVIVPIQRGDLSSVDMLNKVAEILGNRSFVIGIPSNVIGIPSNKEALSLEFCKNLHHHAFHILGRVKMDRDQLERITAIKEGCSAAIITADANWLRSSLKGVAAKVIIEKMKSNCDAFPQFYHHRAAAVKEAINADRCW